MSLRLETWRFTCPANADRSISGLHDPQNFSAILILRLPCRTSSADEEGLVADLGQLLGQFLLALKAAAPFDHDLLRLR